ncbi:MAG: hypothetical protein IV088_15825 [Hydrogenophaga sp.]|uniref:hypothetical protein n=1 Tax=Hydrogenophaga sp. TaxID=1904254 RepID=UPI0025B8EDAC|nr:hypothetical protein [Hydrogenophaga sp.]MBT9552318.1 hypothetical protein [Hydrogenophaga sp.]
MSSGVFQKTESGKAEIARRQAGLSPATRTVLIMVNGSDAVSALMARGLPQLQGHLDTLLALGLIEPVVARATPVVSAPPAVTPPPVAPPASERRPNAAPPAAVPHLDTLRRKAMVHLGNHFGPDTPLVAQALLAARTAAEFNAALDGIESKLAIYLGRKQAARELLALRPAT